MEKDAKKLGFKAWEKKYRLQLRSLGLDAYTYFAWLNKPVKKKRKAKK